MAPEKQDEWYTNKDLYKMVQELKEDVTVCIDALKRYNNLRGELNNVLERLIKIETVEIERKRKGLSTLEWLGLASGWIIALVAIISFLR